METVEAVIKIPKDEYDYMIANPLRYNVCDDETLLYNYIKDGAVLPKGHGRLIDADTYRKEMLDSREFDFFKRLDMQPTIIEKEMPNEK